MTLIVFLILLSAFLALAFWLMLLTVEWWSSPPGIATFILSTVIVVVLGLRVFRIFGGDLPPWLGVASFVFIDVALAAQIIGFLAVRRKKERDNGKEPTRAG